MLGLILQLVFIEQVIDTGMCMRTAGPSMGDATLRKVAAVTTDFEYLMLPNSPLLKNAVAMHTHKLCGEHVHLVGVHLVSFLCK